MKFRIVWVALVFAWIANCSSDTICQPGKTEACACPGGGSGAQTCDTSGKHWLTCICPSQEEPSPGEQPADTNSQTDALLPQEKKPPREEPPRTEPSQKEVYVEKEQESVSLPEEPLSEPPGKEMVSSDAGHQEQSSYEGGPEITPDKQCAAYKVSRPTMLSPERVSPPAIAWNGQEFAVAYGNRVNGVYVVLFARLSSAGKAIGKPTTILQNVQTVGPHRNAQMFWTGKEYVLFILARDVSSAPGNLTNLLYLVRISATGAVIGKASHPIPTSTSVARFAVALNPNNDFGLAWGDSSGLHFVNVSLSGQSQGTKKLITNSFSGLDVGMAWHGSRYLLVYGPLSTQSSQQIQAVYLDSTGKQLTKIGISTSFTFSEHLLAWTGSESIIIWKGTTKQSQTTHAMVVVTPQGNFWKPPGATSPYLIPALSRPTPNTLLFSARWTGTVIEVLFSPVPDYVYLATLQKDGKTAAPLFSVTGHFQAVARALWLGDRYGVVWTGNDGLFFALLQCN